MAGKAIPAGKAALNGINRWEKWYLSGERKKKSEETPHVPAEAVKNLNSAAWERAFMTETRLLLCTAD